MSRVSLRLALVAAVLVCGHVSAQQVHLKSRDIYTGPPLSGQPGLVGQAVSPDNLQPGQIRRVRPARPPETGHRIIQFDHSPGVEDLDALLTAGFQVVANIPDNAIVVTGPKSLPAQITGIRWIGALEPADKISSALDQRQNPVLAIVEFHPDVQQDAQNSVAAAEGVTLQRPAVLLPYHAIVSASPGKLRALASHDEVAYIFPADPALLGAQPPGNISIPCAGMLTLSGPIEQYANIVQGWSPDSDGVAHLGYAFGALTTKVPAATVEAQILRAMNAWSAVANVTFQLAASPTAPRTVFIEFATGAHGDAYPFDAAGTLIAHTFYPVPVNPESIAGDMHLNAVENWHAGSDIDIYTVVLHELGHALGLAHSDNPEDVMYPYYRLGMQLSANDIGAAQALYGAPASLSSSTSTSTSNGAPAPITLAPTGATPLTLTLNPIPAPGQAAQTPISGTVFGGVAPLALQYQTDQGYSGNIGGTSSGAWSVAAVPLVIGTNILTVTAFDSSDQSASQSAVVTRTAPAPAAGTTPLKVVITAPGAAVATVDNASISLGGTASGGTGITRVLWQTSNGASGTATGTTQWLASNVPLLTGTNAIIVRAYDATGASAWASVVVVHP